MAELVDALDSGSSRGNSVDVRLILAAFIVFDKMKNHLSNYPLKAFDDIQTVALVANGAIHDYSLIAPLIKKYQRYVAVDGGLSHCHAMHVQPDLIIGDFDSAASELLQIYADVPKEKFSADKDHTDLELAVAAVNTPKTQRIGIFGALEKRTDHALSNLHLMRRLPGKIVIETEIETLVALENTQNIVCHPGQIVSLIPLGAPTKGVTTHGLKWELKEMTLDKQFMSISNICLFNEFNISIREGDLVCSLLRLG